MTTSFAATGSHTIGLQETDDHGLTTTITKEVTVLEQASASYPEAVQNTPGLIDYYRLDESSGPTILDSKGLSAGSIIGGTFRPARRDLAQHGCQLQRHQRLRRDPAQPLRHEQGDDRVLAQMERLRQQRRPGDGVHPKLNENNGGFLVDPNSGEFGGTFGDRHRSGSGDRNSIFFQRPSAGAWHHYAIVIDTSAAAGSEITPYVDGAPVTFQQESGRHRPGQLRQLDPLPDVTRRQLPLRRRDPGRARDLQPDAGRRQRSSPTTTPKA